MQFLSVQFLTPFFHCWKAYIWKEQWGNSRRSCVLKLKKLDSIPAAVSCCLPCKCGQSLSLITAAMSFSFFWIPNAGHLWPNIREASSSYSCNRNQLELWLQCFNNGLERELMKKNSTPNWLQISGISGHFLTVLLLAALCLCSLRRG